MAEASREYAQALFALAAEVHAEHTYLDALHAVVEQIYATQGYVDLLASPVISRRERIDVLSQAFSGHVPEDIVSFLNLLCDHGQIRSLKKCLSEYEQLYNTAQGISVAKVVSAVQMTDAQKIRLQEKLEIQCGHALRLEFSVDPRILGGIVVHLNGKVLDGSLKHRLHEIEEVMNG